MIGMASLFNISNYLLLSFLCHDPACAAVLSFQKIARLEVWIDWIIFYWRSEF